MAIAAQDLRSDDHDLRTFDEVFSRTRSALLANQHQDVHWRCDLEADCTIPAESVLFPLWALTRYRNHVGVG
jgi:hypothetical protein